MLKKSARASEYLSTYIFILCIFAACSPEGKQHSVVPDSLSSKAWTVIGPGGGGGVFSPTISPFDENLVMSYCDMSGAYVTSNGGIDWRMLNLWTVPVDFEFDPVDSSTIYAATRGYPHSEDRGSGLSILYRSVDQGKRWRIVYPDVRKARDVNKLQNFNYRPSEIVEGAFDGSIEKVTVNPLDNKKIYLGLSPLRAYMGSNRRDEESMPMVVMSSDRGETWSLLAKIPGRSIKAILAGETKHPDELLVFTESACLRIHESTGQTESLPLPVSGIIAVKGGKEVIYIQSVFREEDREIKGGMFVSRNWGRDWTQVNNGLLDRTANSKLPNIRRGFDVCESQPDVAYVSTITPTLNEKGEYQDLFAIYKTTDAGSNWHPVLLSSSEQGYITKNYKGSWLEQSYDAGWGGSPIDLGVAPGNPDVCYGSDNGRAYKTVDGGKMWEQVYSHNMPDSSVASGGLDVTTCYDVHFDPFNKDHLFICYTDIGLFHSFNGGKSWFHSINNIPRDWENTCYDIEFDPSVKGRVWSAWANAHDLPREKMFGPQGFGGYTGGVAISNDHGLTWSKSNNGIPENSVCTNILIDPSTPVDSRTLYVSVFDRGVYKSTDGGKNWERKNNGLGDNLFAWQIRQNSRGRLYVLCSRGNREGKTVDGVIYFSDDNAETWQKLSLPEKVNGPHDLLIDPSNPDLMYVSCWPTTIDGKDSFGGVIKTADGGLTWKQVFDESHRVNSAGLDREYPNKIYINTFQNGAYRSDDHGETWTRIEGYRFKWGQRAIPDINNPGMLYLTTYGGSVFYGPAAGAPDALEDVENIPDGWW